MYDKSLSLLKNSPNQSGAKWTNNATFIGLLNIIKWVNYDELNGTHMLIYSSLIKHYAMSKYLLWI